MSDTDQVHSTRSVVIPSIEMRLGPTARGPTAKVPQTAGTRTTAGPTTGKERTEVMVNIGNAIAAAIAGTIRIGPFSTIVAANYPTFLRAPCLIPADCGSSGRPMAPARRRRMSQYLCWELCPA
jgi:hypothetical protein